MTNFSPDVMANSFPGIPTWALTQERPTMFFALKMFDFTLLTNSELVFAILMTDIEERLSTVYKPHNEEFSVWKAYKPILDKEEPMEIDDDGTYQGENTGCNVHKSENGSSRFWKSSIFELDKGEPIAGNRTEKIRDKTNLDISSPENFEDSDYEIPEDNDDVPEYYLSDAEFEEWLQDHMQQLNEDEELKQN
ncbi:hypothetical protein AVEN_90615-1 [Araneus ventricosus]|uniref:Uncharacterized protein n=1 Tax=Araneus ventricosus TaxID=182803 RepID=A0A4Y2MZ41_ARAVE|nr:hypothetical protein AVEN_90615-1 [Araneus ventricosus]